MTLADLPQHYMIATTPTSLIVAFMGTKRWEDLLADANLLHTPVWAESAALAADAVGGAGRPRVAGWRAGDGRSAISGTAGAVALHAGHCISS